MVAHHALVAFAVIEEHAHPLVQVVLRPKWHHLAFRFGFLRCTSASRNRCDVGIFGFD